MSDISSTTQTAADSTQDVPGAVIAIPESRGGFHGRYLHHAPDPAATARLLRDLFTVRYPGRKGYARARSELIGQHPSGWRHLGIATAKDPEVKPRRAPAPVGTCYCHQPDGTWHPAVTAAALATLGRAESAAIRGEHTSPGWLLGQQPRPGDGSPLLIREHHVPDGIDHVYLLHEDGLQIPRRSAPECGSPAVARVAPRQRARRPQPAGPPRVPTRVVPGCPAAAGLPPVDNRGGRSRSCPRPRTGSSKGGSDQLPESPMVPRPRFPERRHRPGPCRRPGLRDAGPARWPAWRPHGPAAGRSAGGWPCRSGWCHRSRSAGTRNHPRQAQPP